MRLPTPEGEFMLKRLPIMLLLALVLKAVSVQAAVEFIYPAAHSWVDRSGHMIIKFNENDLSGVRVTVNGVASDMIEVGSPEYRKLFQDFFIAQAIWDEGPNKLQVDLFRGGQKIETAFTDIYYVVQDKRQAPPEFVANVMHIPEREQQCIACHNMKATPAQMNSNIAKENPCYRCHKKLVNFKYVHGPVGTYSCGYCHSSKGTPKYSVPKRGAALCYECHADMAVQMKQRKYVHGPIEAGMCESCHDSHGSQNESQLIKPVNELCLSCHGHLRTKIHVVRTTTGEGHPLKGKPDPLRKASGKEMSCTSCHNPHGGQVRYFFIGNPEDRLALCQQCHNK